MHDPRYTKTKDISEVAPEWSHGCQSCKFGIVSAPDILAAFPFYEGRAVQAHEDMIEFCTCRAGHMHRQCLRRRYNALSLETVRVVLEHIAANSVPSIRLEPA